MVCGSTFQMIEFSISREGFDLQEIITDNNRSIVQYLWNNIFFFF